MPDSHQTQAVVLNALSMTARAPVAGYGGVAFQIQGTFTGTLTFEASVHGADFEPFRVTKSDNSTPVTTTTTTGIYSGSVSGYAAVRVRMSSFSTGAASVIILAAPASTGGAGGGGGSGTDVNLIEVGGAAIALGEAIMAASVPVVIASDQSPIQVTGSISATNPSVGPTGDPVPDEATLIGFSDAAGDLTALASVNIDYNSTTPPVVPISVIGIALPGAGGPVAGGTAANPIRINPTGTTTQPVSAASLPLPTGAATAALQTQPGVDIGDVTVNNAGGGAAVNIQDGGNTITVDGTVAATQSGAWDIGTVTAVTAITNALPAGNNNIGDVDVASVVPGTGATNLGKAEDAGHTSGDVGVLALAVRNDTPNAAVTNANTDYSQFSVDKAGLVRVAPPESDFAVLGSSHVKKYYTNAGAVTDGIIWSPAAGTRWYVTSLFLNVSAACTVTLEDDLSGGDAPVAKMELAANSGWSSTFPVPLFSGEDAADLLITTTAGNVYVTVVGYEI